MTWAVLSIIEFKDGDDVSWQPLGRGMTKAAAKKLQAMVPAVAYSGERSVGRAYLRVMEDYLVDQLIAASKEP